MSKLWFMDHLGRSVAKSRVREICVRMELTEQETRLLFERFCDRKNAEQCDFYPPDSQKKHLPDLDRKVRGWVERNASFFSLVELHGILKFFNSRQAVE